MQLQFTLLATTTLLPLLASAHMMLDHKAVWGYKSQGGSLETPLNMQTGGNWLHHKAKKDTNEVVTLTPGQGQDLKIVCGEALGGNPSSKCKTKGDVHMGGGCAISIAYKDPASGGITKDDFRVISVVHDCPTLNPFTHSFAIPANLPKCAKCTCAWHWVPNPKSSANEMYMNTFNCKVAGNKGGKIKTAKKPIYFGVEGGVKGNGERPMYMNKFSNGAQKLTVG